MASSNYNINIFKPKTPYTKINSIIILTMIAIWAVAVFGFQFLLRFSETPTPEKGYITFEQSWGKIQKGRVTVGETRELVKVLLSVSGKSIKARSNESLRKFTTLLTYNLVPQEARPAYVALTKELKNNKDIDTSYLAAMLGLKKDDLVAKAIPYTLVPADKAVLTQAELKEIPALMKKYLIHNQSVLTDTKFLGFPFHYFYTSVFLLILFVVLCWSYCIIIERVNKKYGIETDEG